jgi:hypothetical protein
LACGLAGTTGTAYAEIPNLAVGDKDNKISIHAGVSVRGRFEELYLLGLQYSQPNHFFRLPGRLNVELMTAYGSGEELSRYTQPVVFGFAQDLVIPLYRPKPVYAGINLGIYIKSHTTDRIDSKFTFGEKVFLGIDIFESMRLELYVRHFSNGTLTEQNSGQNFAGLSVIKNF